VLDRRDGRPFLRRERDGWLRAHYQRAIGWARCGGVSEQPTLAP